MVFAIHWHDSAMGLPVFPILNPLPPPSPSPPSGSSQCPSPEHPSHASNLCWWSVSPLIVYLFQCCSLWTMDSTINVKILWRLNGITNVKGEGNMKSQHISQRRCMCVSSNSGRKRIIMETLLFRLISLKWRRRIVFPWSFEWHLNSVCF